MSDNVSQDEAAGKHTPGPWVQTCESIDPDWHIVTTKGGAIVANVFAPQSSNARLIAAAPDMLEALRTMTALCKLKYGNLDADVWAEIQRAEAIAAKATEGKG
jgi:hypothetical protein